MGISMFLDKNGSVKKMIELPTINQHNSEANDANVTQQSSSFFNQGDDWITAL